MKIIKIFFSLFLFLILISTAQACVKTYTFVTAAIDGPDYEADGSYNYINPVIVGIDGIVKTGTPAVRFNVCSNEVLDVTYTAYSYKADVDDFYFDSGLSTCSGSTCHLSTCQFETDCGYSSSSGLWKCIVVDTESQQYIGFLYNKNDPTYGEVVLAINTLYPAECNPGETETKQCGQTDVGECTYGTQRRTCGPDFSWGSWGSCIGSVYPVTEICDGKDNDCDGLIDEEGVCWICTPGETDTKQCGQTDVGECEYGTQTKTCNSQGQWGSWGSCIGSVYPVTEICDELDNDCDSEIDEGDVCDNLLDINSVLGITRFSILNDDYLRPETSVMVLVTLENNGNTNLDNILLTLIVPELDIRKRIGPFDIKKNKETTKLIMLEIPSWAESGYYDIRATASNGDVRRIKHREMVIHN